MDLAVDSAVNRMDQPVAAAIARVLEKCRGEDSLATCCKSDLYRVVHATRHDRFDRATLGPPSKDVRCARDKCLATGERVSLFFEGTLAPVNPAIGSDVGTMQVIGTAIQGLAVEPDLAFVSHPVVIGVRQLPDLWRCTDVDRPLMPGAAFREHHAIRKHDALVEDPVAIDVFQPEDAVRLVLQLDLDRIVGTAGVSNIEPAAVIKVGADRAANKWRSGDWLDCETIRDRERVAAKLHVLGLGRPLAEECQQGDGETE